MPTIKIYLSDFPGGAVDKNPPAKTVDTGSITGLGRLHMPRRTYTCVPQPLSLRSRASDPHLWSPRATTTEAPTPRAHAPQQEKPPQREACEPQ